MGAAGVQMRGNAWNRVQRRDKDAPASKSGETPGVGSNGVIWVRPASKSGETPGVGSNDVIRVYRRSKVEEALETGPNSEIRVHLCSRSIHVCNNSVNFYYLHPPQRTKLCYHKLLERSCP